VGGNRGNGSVADNETTCTLDKLFGVTDGADVSAYSAASRLRLYRCAEHSSAAHETQACRQPHFAGELSHGNQTGALETNARSGNQNDTEMMFYASGDEADTTFQMYVGGEVRSRRGARADDRVPSSCKRPSRSRRSSRTAQSSRTGAPSP